MFTHPHTHTFVRTHKEQRIGNVRIEFYLFFSPPFPFQIILSFTLRSEVQIGFKRTLNNGYFFVVSLIDANKTTTAEATSKKYWTRVKFVLGFWWCRLHTAYNLPKVLPHSWVYSTHEILIHCCNNSNMKYAWRYQHHFDGIMFREQKNGDLQAKHWMTYWPRRHYSILVVLSLCIRARLLSKMNTSFIQIIFFSRISSYQGWKIFWLLFRLPSWITVEQFLLSSFYSHRISSLCADKKGRSSLLWDTSGIMKLMRYIWAHLIEIHKNLWKLCNSLNSIWKCLS